MFRTDDTIVAISTPLGAGALGVVRMSGPEAARIAKELTGRQEPLAARHATFARVSLTDVGSDRQAISIGDHVVLTYFPAPHSATGDDVVEISAHGSLVVLQQIIRAAIRAGARLAEPGEFTLRGFLNGKIDLVQAEAVADLIQSVTPLQARAAFDQLEGTLTSRIATIESGLFDLIARLEASLDFPDEGYHFVRRGHAGQEVGALIARIDELLCDARRGRVIREGASIAIIGTPNVGKSSLFNALVNANRAIVTSIPGTTRDLLTERANVCGVAVSLVDTAGLRESSDPIEQEGVARARQVMTVAALTLLVLDRSRPLNGDDRELLAVTTQGSRERPALVVVNKIDLPAAWDTACLGVPALEISAASGTGLEPLRRQAAAALGVGELMRDPPIVSNVRHVALLGDAHAALARASDALTASEGGISEEFVLADLQEAASALQSITGRRTNEDLLGHIFSRFCIGK
jgi:tRNA modification GTPase